MIGKQFELNGRGELELVLLFENRDGAFEFGFHEGAQKLGFFLVETDDRARSSERVVALVAIHQNK